MHVLLELGHEDRPLARVDLEPRHRPALDAGEHLLLAQRLREPAGEAGAPTPARAPRRRERASRAGSGWTRFTTKPTKGIRFSVSRRWK